MKVPCMSLRNSCLHHWSCCINFRTPHRIKSQEGEGCWIPTQPVFTGLLGIYSLCWSGIPLRDLMVEGKVKVDGLFPLQIEFTKLQWIRWADKSVGISTAVKLPTFNDVLRLIDKRRVCWTDESAAKEETERHHYESIVWWCWFRSFRIAQDKSLYRCFWFRILSAT